MLQQNRENNIQTYLKASFVFVTTTAAFLLVKTTGVFPNWLWSNGKNGLEDNALVLGEKNPLINLVPNESSLLAQSNEAVLVVSSVPTEISASIPGNDIEFEELELSEAVDTTRNIVPEDLSESTISWNTDEGVKISPIARKLLFSTPISQTYFPAVVNLPNLMANQGIIFNGEAAGDWSGRSVAYAGDVNGDGIDDLIIAAEGAAPYGVYRAGRSYLVFGKTGTWNNLFELASLDGNNGVIFDGTTRAVSYAGDVNGDGIDDLIIGSPGCSNVVFGKKGHWDSPFALSSLMGNNGTIIIGEDPGDQNGFAVSYAGDVNADGIDDLIIGAYQSPPNTNFQTQYQGRSYLVFGKNGTWMSPFTLSSLDGSSGVKFDGEMGYDLSGFSVGYAGDVNSDGIADIIIGAKLATRNGNTYAGRSYVVFGKAGAWSSPFALSSLNGTNGIIFDGEIPYSQSGGAVSHAGDVNGDGIDDILIGTHYYDNSAGKGQVGSSYLVFGKNSTWISPFQLSNSPGSNGITFKGEQFDDCGYSVSYAGDMNGDGIADVIIGADQAAPNNNEGAGRSYVVFGQINGWNNPFELTSLTGGDGIIFNGGLCDYSGIAVNYAGDINGDGVDDVVIGAWRSSLNNRSDAGRSYVVFGDIAPYLTANCLTIYPGQTLQLNSTYLSAIDYNHDNSTLIITVANVQHGHFEFVNVSGISINSFEQFQIWQNNIQFVHDGTKWAPSYWVTVNSSGLALTPSFQAAEITFISNSTIGSFSGGQIVSSGSSTFSKSSSSISASSELSSTADTVSVLSTISSTGNFNNPSTHDVLSTSDTVSVGQIASSMSSAFSSSSASISTSSGLNNVIETISSSSATVFSTGILIPSTSSSTPESIKSSAANLLSSSTTTTSLASGMSGVEEEVVNKPQSSSNDQTVKIVSIVVPVGSVALLAGLGMFCKYRLRKAEVEAEKQKAATQEKYIELQIRREDKVRSPTIGLSNVPVQIIESDEPSLIPTQKSEKSKQTEASQSTWAAPSVSR